MDFSAGGGCGDVDDPGHTEAVREYLVEGCERGRRERGQDRRSFGEAVPLCADLLRVGAAQGDVEGVCALVVGLGDPQEIAWQAAKIGYELAGELAGGVQAWADDEHDLTSTRLIKPQQVAGAGRVLDIRQDAEFRAGHLPGARHLELGALARDTSTDGDTERAAAARPAGDASAGDGAKELHDVGVVMCGHGERAMGAASLLERRGPRNVAVLQGGPQDWAKVTGQDLQEQS